jgi:PAS domain S-box-containing protein
VRDPAGAVADLEWSYANPAMAHMLRADGDLVGRRLLESLPGHRSHPVLFPSYRRVIDTGASEEVEAFYDADGIRGWFRVAAVKLNDGVAISLRDITGRKEHEAALEESEARFRLLADAVDDVFWIIDVPERKVIYASPACERVWGLSREALYRDPATWRRNVHPEDRALADPVFDEMLAGRRETFELVYRMRRPDGGLRWVRDKGWRVRAGEVQRVVGIMTDISAEKASEEKQRLLIRELDHRLRNTFTLVQSIVRLSARSAEGVGELVAGVRDADSRAGARPGARGARFGAHGGPRGDRPREPGVPCRPVGPGHDRRARGPRRRQRGAAVPHGVPRAGDQRDQVWRALGARREGRGRLAELQ